MECVHARMHTHAQTHGERERNGTNIIHGKPNPDLYFGANWIPILSYISFN